MKMMPFFLVMVFVMLGLVSCSGATDRAYERGYADGHAEGKAKSFAEGYDNGFAAGKQQGLSEGYDKGFPEGKAQGVVEGRASLDALIQDAFDRGYSAGIAASSPAEIVKIVSYSVRDAITVVGEVQNMSDRGLDAVIVGVQLDGQGGALSVSSNLWRRYIPARETIPFQLNFFPSGQVPADARLFIAWN
jgi:ribosome modulation factor